MKIISLLFQTRIKAKIKELEKQKKIYSHKMSMQEKANIFNHNKRIDFAIKILNEL
jgi:hypothetical protein